MMRLLIQFDQKSNFDGLYKMLTMFHYLSLMFLYFFQLNTFIFIWQKFFLFILDKNQSPILNVNS